MSGDTRPAERILRAHGRGTWASTVAQMRGAADKTAATVRMVLVSALKCLEDPRIAECLMPEPGAEFRIEEFLVAEGSLYLMADPRGETSPVAPVFSALVNEIHWTACQMAAAERGERLDPPLLVQLDEVAKLCPGLPVPSLLADSGGRGITMVIACQGLAQLEEVWGKSAVRSSWTRRTSCTCAASRTPRRSRWRPTCATSPPTTRAGRPARPRTTRWRHQGMISRLPKRRALVLRGGCAPVIAHLPMVWNDWALPPGAPERQHCGRPDHRRGGVCARGRADRAAARSRARRGPGARRARGRVGERSRGGRRVVTAGRRRRGPRYPWDTAVSTGQGGENPLEAVLQQLAELRDQVSLLEAARAARRRADRQAHGGGAPRPGRPERRRRRRGLQADPGAAVVAAARRRARTRGRAAPVLG